MNVLPNINIMFLNKVTSKCNKLKKDKVDICAKINKDEHAILLCVLQMCRADSSEHVSMCKCNYLVCTKLGVKRFPIYYEKEHCA